MTKDIAMVITLNASSINGRIVFSYKLIDFIVKY